MHFDLTFTGRCAHSVAEAVADAVNSSSSGGGGGGGGNLDTPPSIYEISEPVLVERLEPVCPHVHSAEYASTHNAHKDTLHDFVFKCLYSWASKVACKMPNNMMHAFQGRLVHAHIAGHRRKKTRMSAKPDLFVRFLCPMLANAGGECGG